jgi:hypothetical protein
MPESLNSNESTEWIAGEDVELSITRIDGEYTQVEIASTAVGGEHPDLATHDALGLATDAELATHAAAADPHTGYVKENDASWTDLTDGGATVLHSHAGGGGVDSIAKSGSAALTGDVTLSEGANVTLTQVGQDIEIAATGAAGAPSTVDYLVGTADGGLSNEIVVGATPGGELGGTWASPTVDATHAGSTHTAATDTHIADAADAHDASAISVDSTTLVGVGTDVQAVFEEVDNDIAALKAVDYLVGTATGTLSGEIVAGTAPGGELGGTWASPTVDATHSGSTHSASTDTHIADTSAAHAASAVSADSTTLVGVGTDVQAVLEELDNGIADHLADVTDVHDHGSLAGLTDDDHTQYLKETDVAAKGDIYAATADNTVGVLTVGANDTILMADSGTATGLKWAAAATTTELAAVGEAEAAGTSDTYARGDHVHDASAYQLESGLQAVKFSVGALLEGAPPSNGFRMVWRAPFACTVTNVRTHIDAGTNAVCNARKNQASDFLASDFTNSTADAWGDGGAVQNTAIAAGDDIEVELVSTSGAVTQVNIQVDLTRIIPS